MKTINRWTKLIVLCAMLLGGTSACSSAGGGSEATLTIFGATTSQAALSSSALTMDLQTPPEEGAGAAASLTIKLFALYVSPNTDCTDAVLVDDYGDEGNTVDMADNPTLFSGTIEEGDYPCVIIKMADTLSYRPDADAEEAFPELCDTDVTYTGDIYRANSDETPWRDIDGNEIEGRGDEETPVEDVVYIFASTDSDDLLEGSLGVVENQSIALTSSLSSPGSSTFIFDTTDWVVDRNETCSLEGGTMGFE
jgi:hypothetical protein